MKKKFTVEGPIQGLDIGCPRCGARFEALVNLGALIAGDDKRFEKVKVIPDEIKCPRCDYDGS